MNLPDLVRSVILVTTPAGYANRVLVMGTLVTKPNTHAGMVIARVDCFGVRA